MTRPTAETGPTGCFTVDVEDWFHILDAPGVPTLQQWDGLESRVSRCMEGLLELLERSGVRASMFWLGWVAERHPELLRRCHQAGHEIASHGYAHVLPHTVGRAAFLDDISRGKAILEDLVGVPVNGFRAAGFGANRHAPWALDVIREAGYRFDSSVFPSAHGHGGRPGFRLGPQVVETGSGPLAEIPLSVVTVAGRRIPLFGGGYLRLAPLPAIRWGVQHLQAHGLPTIVYIHPREIDREQPRLKLPLVRRFKSYVNLRSTRPKLEWLVGNVSFRKMGELADSLLSART